MSAPSAESDAPKALLDQTIQTGKRNRTKTAAFSPVKAAVKEAFVVAPGNGVALRSLDEVVSNLKSIPGHDPRLKDLHRAMFGVLGKGTQRKKNVLDFSGLGEGEETRAGASLGKWSTAQLRGMMDKLGVDRSAKSFADGKTSKENLVDRMVEWLKAPHAKVSKSKGASAKRKGAKSKKEASKKRPRVAQPAASDEENVAVGSESDEGADDGDVDEGPAVKRPRRAMAPRGIPQFTNSRFMLAPGSAEAKEYAAKIKKMRAARTKANARMKAAGTKRRARGAKRNAKKKAKAARMAKKRARAADAKKKEAKKRKRHAAAPAEKKAKKTKARAPASSESSDDSSSDDEPISAVSFKKKLRCATMELLKKANMDELSVKALVRQVAKSMGKSKSEMKVHKAFIKEMAVNFCTSGA